jgi:hypothetical protein
MRFLFNVSYNYLNFNKSMARILPLKISSKSFTKLFAGIILALGFHLEASAQTALYKSVSSGLWGDKLTWNRSNDGGSSWSALGSSTNPPTYANSAQILIRPGTEVTVAAGVNVDQVLVESGGTLTVNSGIALNIMDTDGIDLIVDGTVKNEGTISNSTGATVGFQANSIYKHNYTTTFGSIPTAIWDVTSTVEFNEFTTPGGGKTGYTQAFGNVKWNTPNLTGNANLAGSLTTIKGNFEIASTNGAILLLSNNTIDYTLNLDGNLTIAGNSILNLGSGTGTTYSVKVNLGGDLAITGSANLRHGNIDNPAKITFTGIGKTINIANPTGNGSVNGGYINYDVASGGNVTLNSDLYLGTTGITRDFVVNGILNIGSKTIIGQGNFIVSYNSTLGIGSAGGIALSGNTGNIQVSGFRSFGLANYIYNGTTTQITGTGLPADVTGLTINNTAGVSLSKPVAVNTLFNMVKGVFYTSSANTLTINNLVAVNAAESGSYVDGPISHKVETFDTNVELNFPVGKSGNYRPVVLTVYQYSGSPNSSTTYTAEQFEQAYSTVDPLPGTVNKISKVRYFKISKSNSDDVTASVKMTYGSDDGVTDYQNLTIAKYNSTNKWIDIMAVGAADGTITSDYFDNFSDFVLANKVAGSNPLPVELIKFTAKSKVNGVEVKWATATEKNSAYFDVERSANGIDFTEIGQVEGKGNSNELQAYELLDKAPFAGVNYYRLKQVDLDGSFTYSNIVSVKLGDKSVPVVIYPNPASANLNLHLAMGSSSTVVKVINLLGIEVYRNTYNGSDLAIDVSGIANGSYLIITENELGQTVSKFIKN